MEYKDAVGTDIVRGDRIVYSVLGGGLQLGRVLELSTQNTQDYTKKPLPQKIITCAEYKYCSNPAYVGSRKCPTKDNHAVGRSRYPTKKIPALKIQGARKKWNSVDKFEKLRPSLIVKFENVLVINQNLPAMMTLL